jgi:hypothetical protein
MKKVLFLGLFIITCQNMLLAQRGTLDWEISKQEVAPLTTKISFSANIPDSIAIFPLKIPNQTAVPLFIQFPETSCFQITKHLRELSSPHINSVILEAFNTEIKVHTQNIQLEMEIKQIKSPCIKSVKEGYIEYMVVYNNRTFYPPTIYDFRIKL